LEEIPALTEVDASGSLGELEDEAAEEVGVEELDLGHYLLTHKTECHFHGI
jgi:hypothetical protein